MGQPLTSMTETKTRGQACDLRFVPISLDLTKSGIQLQHYDYKYGVYDSATNTVDETKNNGQIARIEGLISTVKQWQQNLAYDSLGRLSSAREFRGDNNQQSRLVNYNYDVFGNRWIDLGGGVQSLYFNAGNNRISGWSYDAAGNLLNDTVHSYTYDAENKISKVDNVTAYVYDGAGHRVKKLVGENTRFVYGIGGELIAEFDGATGNLKKEYVYGGATLITIEPTAVNANGTQYATGDHLGSPRVVTNSSGAVMSRHDYQPFGTELGAGVGGRTTAMGFSGSGDNNRKKFTGYERDTETGLDFAQARYYSSTQGRFTSPDSLLGSIGNPQSLNRYAYVGNNPLNFSDPTGHTRFDASSSTGGDQGGYMSPNNPDFDPGTLPQRDEDEIARIKALIADTGATAGPYNGDGIVDTNAGETAAGEGEAPQNSLVDDPQKRSDTSGDKDIKPPDVKTESLTPCVQKYLSGFFGGQSLAGIQIQRDYLPPIAPSDARAFTSTGDLISFNKGEYQPNTMEGIALIGHEITHNFQARKYGDARFGVLYLGDSAVQWVRGRDVYLGNRFEKEAFAKEKEIRADLAKHGNPCQ